MTQTRGDTLQQYIQQEKLQNEKNGIAISGYSDEIIIFSQAIIITEKTTAQALIDIYNTQTQEIWNQTKHIVIHRIHNTQLIQIKDINTMDPQIHGCCVVQDDGKNHGAILPGTSSITQTQQALLTIKKQHNIVGKSHIYSFETINHRLDLSQ